MSVPGSLSENLLCAQGQVPGSKEGRLEGWGGLQHTMAAHGAHSLTETDVCKHVDVDFP